MLKDSQIVKLSLAVTLIGIAAIYFLANVIGPETMAVSEIDRSDTGRQVVVSGTVTSSYTSNGNLFMKITDNRANITVVMFENPGDTPEPGSQVTVIGQVNTYKNTVEIIARSVTKWNS